jgi:small subunit ribosomal protein S3
MKKLKQAGVSKVVIERPHKKCRVTIMPPVRAWSSARRAPTSRSCARSWQDDRSEVHLNIVEDPQAGNRRQLVAEGIAQQLERRVAFRRAMKRAVQSAMRLGAEGHQDHLRRPSRRRRNRPHRMVSRRPRAAAHAARRHRLRHRRSQTAYGIIGVKVWIFKGEILEHDPMARTADDGGADLRRPRPRATVNAR